MKIYTKTGDKGETGIIGKRLKKSDLIFDCLGNLDELNAHFGILFSIFEKDEKFSEIFNIIKSIQNVLFGIGAQTSGSKIKLNLGKKVSLLEKSIDELSLNLTPLKNFILPSGSGAISQIHLCRAVCRRCERSFVKLSNQIEVEALTLKYLNRLSDWIFTIARVYSQVEEIEEVLWKNEEK